uniref:Glycine rich superfamily member n=1 Tax=Rhipicephalus zambeziensis TaxID=60191 RepID=A0A224Y6C8_9ACAR
MIMDVVTVKVLVLFLALANFNSAFRIPNQDEITNAISNAMLRQAGADLSRKLMKKFDRTFGGNPRGPTAGSGGGDMLGMPVGNTGGNFGPPSSGTGGNGLLSAVLQGVTNGLTASFGGSSAGLPGSGGLMNTLAQGFGAPTSGAAGGGLINALTQGLGGNSVAPTPGGRGQGTGILSRVLGNIGTTYGQSNTNSAGAALVNTILQQTASALNSHRASHNKEGFRMR